MNSETAAVLNENQSEMVQLENMLSKWHVDYLNLKEALNLEQEALEKRNFEELGKVTKNKNACMLAINSHDLPPSFKKGKNFSLKELNDFFLSQPKLSSRWNEIVGLLDDCNFQNEVNGRLINLLDNSCRRVFNLLKGMDPDNNIYNASGACSRLQASRSSVSA